MTRFPTRAASRLADAERGPRREAVIERLERCNPEAEIRFVPADGEPIYALDGFGRLALAAFHEDERTILAQAEPDDTKEVAR